MQKSFQMQLFQVIHRRFFTATSITCSCDSNCPDGTTHRFTLWITYLTFSVKWPINESSTSILCFLVSTLCLLFQAEFNQFCFSLFSHLYSNSSFLQLSVGEWRMLCLKPLVAILLPLFCYSHTYRTISVVVDLTYAGIILISFPFIVVQLMVRKAEGLVWVPVVTRRGCYNSARCLLVGIGSKLPSSGLGLEKRDLSLGLNRPCYSRAGETF
jgi:hypothetical protein